MSGARKLQLLLAAGAIATSNGQFLSRVGALRGVSGFSGSSSSFMRSSVWLPGRDGQMHEETHEVHTETIRDNDAAVKRMHSEIACKDGNCQQTMNLASPGSIVIMNQQGPAARDSYSLMPSRIGALLQSIPVPRVIVALRPRPSPEFLAPRPEAVQNPAPKRGPAMADVIVPLAALSGAVTSLLLLIVGSVLKCQRSEAREVPLRALGEPLSPAQEAAAAGHRAPVHAAPAAIPVEPKEAGSAEVSMYLQEVYARAVVAAETTAVKTYLSRVYQQSCM